MCGDDFLLATSRFLVIVYFLGVLCALLSEWPLHCGIWAGMVS